MQSSFFLIPDYCDALLRRDHLYYDGCVGLIPRLLACWLTYNNSVYVKAIMDIENDVRNLEEGKDEDFLQQVAVLEADRDAKINECLYMLQYQLEYTDMIYEEEIRQAAADHENELAKVKIKLTEDLESRKRKLEQEQREPLNIDKFDVSMTMDNTSASARESSARRRKQPKRGAGGFNAINNGPNASAGSGGSSSATGDNYNTYYSENRMSGLDLLTNVGMANATTTTTTATTTTTTTRPYGKKVRTKDLQPNLKLSEQDVMADITLINTALGKVVNPLPKRAATTKRRS